MPEIVDGGVAQGQQKRADILFAKEMMFSKVVFSSQKFVEGYSFLPEIVHGGVAQGQQERVEWQTLDVTSCCSSQGLVAQTARIFENLCTRDLHG